MPGLTETIGEFVIQTDLDDVPPKAIALAKSAIVDCIGMTIAGSREEASMIIRKYAQDLGGVANTSIIGTRIRTTGPLAALANGVAGHVLDLDDINSVLIGHPSVVLVPALLAAGELTHASGKRILSGFILGFEVMVKLASLLNPDHYEHGWHGTSTFGPLGASIGAAKIFGLNQEETQRAVGLATSLAGGVRSNFGTMTKPYHAGNAARAGLESALLCEMGFTANAEILECSMGFLDVYGKTSSIACNSISGDLGNPYELVSSGLDFKRYPCCGGALAAVDAAMAIRKNQKFSVDMIESITCGENELGLKLLTYSNPKTPLEAKFSMEYCVCRVLLDGQLGLGEFKEEKVKEPKLQDLLKKTRSFFHPELQSPNDSGRNHAQRFPAIITVRLKDGTELMERVDNAKGRWDNPLTQEEVFEKYRSYAGIYLRKDNVEKSLEFLTRLESLKDISELMVELTWESL